MQFGQISNRQAPIIAFNVDSLLFRDTPKQGFLQRIFDSLKSDKQKYFNKEIDDIFVATIEALWYKNPYCIYFLTFTDYEEEISELLFERNIPYTRIVTYNSIEDLRVDVQYRFMYYFDKNEEILSLVSQKNALHINELSFNM